MTLVKQDDLDKPTALLLNGRDVAKMIGHLNYAKVCYEQDGKFTNRDTDDLVESVDQLKRKIEEQI